MDFIVIKEKTDAAIQQAIDAAFDAGGECIELAPGDIMNASPSS
jgi:hypothetical protein